jgi:hypothetical protein
MKKLKTRERGRPVSDCGATRASIRLHFVSVFAALRRDETARQEEIPNFKFQTSARRVLPRAGRPALRSRLAQSSRARSKQIRAVKQLGPSWSRSVKAGQAWSDRESRSSPWRVRAGWALRGDADHEVAKFNLI